MTNESLREMARQAQRRNEARAVTERLVTQVGRCRCGKDAVECLSEFLDFYKITRELP